MQLRYRGQRQEIDQQRNLFYKVIPTLLKKKEVFNVREFIKFSQQQQTKIKDIKVNPAKNQRSSQARIKEIQLSPKKNSKKKSWQKVAQKYGATRSPQKRSRSKDSQILLKVSPQTKTQRKEAQYQNKIPQQQLSRLKIIQQSPKRISHQQLQLKVIQQIAKSVQQQPIIRQRIVQTGPKENTKLQNPYLVYTNSQKNSRAQEIQSNMVRLLQDLSNVHGNPGFINPIILYASEVKCDTNQDKNALFYQLINRFMRQSNILLLNQKQLQEEWKYFYVSDLLREVKKLPRCHQKIVYRGVSYYPEVKVGQIITFKSFISTSCSRKVAQNFLGKDRGILFQIKIESGSLLNSLSTFFEQQQVLLLPYSEFRVQQMKLSNSKEKNYIVVGLTQIRNEAADGYISLYGQNLMVDNICSELSYFFVYLPHQEYKSYRKENEFYTFTYKGDHTKISQIIFELNQNVRFLRTEWTSLTLSNGFKLHKQITIGMLKKLLLRHNIDGLIIIPENIDKAKSPLQQKYEFLSLPINLNPQETDYTITLNFNVPNTDYVLSFQAKVTDILQAIFNLFYQTVKKEFKISLDNDLIKTIRISSSLDRQENLLHINLLKQYIKNIALIYNKVIIFLELKQKQNFKKQIMFGSRKIKIYKENSDKFVEMFFEEVRFLTFKAVYQTKIKINQQNRQQIDQNSIRFLIVMDSVVKQNQKLQMLSQYYYFSNNLTLFGRIISEKVIFYKQLRELTQSSSFQKYQLNNLYPERKQGDIAFFNSMIMRQVEVKASQTSLQYFRNAQNVKPIYVYTANNIYGQAQYIDQQGKKTVSIQKFYYLINKYLRQILNITYQPQRLHKDWRLLFTCSLQQKLELITNFRRTFAQTIVYRGVDYYFDGKVGQIVTFKSFLSATSKQSATYSFMFGNGTANGTLLEIKIILGKSIEQFSAIRKEQQVLLSPYSQFKIISRQQQTINGRMVTRIKLQELNEQQSPSAYPSLWFNVIIWVDNKIAEGREIYQKASYFKETTYFIQITTNQQLKDWLSQNQNKFLINEAENVAFVSNMKRGDNPIAGIEGLIEFQKNQSHHQIPVFFFVNNLDVTKKHLSDHKLSIKKFDKIEVGRTKIQLQSFLKRALKIQPQLEKKCLVM